MKLLKLLKEAGVSYDVVPKNIEVFGMTDDSRKVGPGDVFVAIKGLEHDGHDYIEQAINSGASAVLFNANSKFKILNLKFKNIVAVPVEDTRTVLGLLWAAWFDFPSRKLKVIGVTGTDGKTTTANIIYHILKNSGKNVGLVSTINARIGNREIDTGFHVTNPEPELLQKLLKEMVDSKIEYAVLEVTSHGIDQERIAGVSFHGAVITNVTHEHLDYHKNYDNYLETKARLFCHVSISILNKDDSSYAFIKSKASGEIIDYSIKESASIFATDILLNGDKSQFTLNAKAQKVLVSLNIPGLYNISNSLAASAVCLELGINLSQIRQGLESFSHLEGRFDEIKLGQPFRVFIDFAHTPNALEQVLMLSQKLRTKNSKLIAAFGCAGERDREKRSMMGEIAGKMADLAIITAEDPRRENVNDIINQIAEGFVKVGAAEIQKSPPEMDQPLVEKIKNKKSGKYHHFVKIPDRREAIEFALSSARVNDIVIITGKGHERSMCFGAKEYPWSDRETAVSILSNLGYKKL